MFKKQNLLYVNVQTLGKDTPHALHFDSTVNQQVIKINVHEFTQHIVEVQIYEALKSGVRIHYP